MFGFRPYPTPIVKPLWPFMVAGGITFFLVAKVQASGVSTEEARKDPRNPYALKPVAH